MLQDMVYEGCAGAGDANVDRELWGLGGRWERGGNPTRGSSRVKGVWVARRDVVWISSHRRCKRQTSRVPPSWSDHSSWYLLAYRMTS